MTKEKKWYGTWPANCDICDADLRETDTFFDALTKSSRWGLLCPGCFALFGIGIGVGRGQEYDSETLIKIHG